MEHNANGPASPNQRALLLLDPADNILIAAKSLPRGWMEPWDGLVLTIPQAIEVGHKIARFALTKGDKVFRYGCPIGTMTADAAAGDHIHQHNLASDYLPAHGRDAAQKVIGG
jgi:hypothetical protein